jgi:hypothetical protein
MTKDDIKRAILTGVISGISTAVTLLVLLFGYVEFESWHRKYKTDKANEVRDSTPPDKRSGSFCPKCNSKDVGRYFYGYYNEGTADSATVQAVNSKMLIPGGCVLSSTNPKYKCNRCDYEWGNYK